MGVDVKIVGVNLNIVGVDVNIVELCSLSYIFIDVKNVYCHI